MWKFKRIRLSYRIFFTLTSVLFLLFACISWLAFSFAESVLRSHLDLNLKQTVSNIETVVETSADLSIRSYLRAVAEQKMQIASELHQRNLAGEISLDEAKNQAESVLLSSRIGPSGYCYVLDSQGTILLHPNKDLVQQNVAEFEFVQNQINQRQGIITYRWRNPGEEQERDKILYMTYFQPWDWLVSASAYRDELVWLVEPDDFREKLLNIKVGEKGFPFLLALDGTILVHPDLHGNVYEIDDPAADLLRKAVANYSSDNLASSFFEKNDDDEIVFSERIDELGWLAGVLCHEEDFFQPLKKIGNIFIGFHLLGLLATVLASLYLSRSITAPLHALLSSLFASARDLQLKPFRPGHQDEIEEISSYCANYIENLKKNNQKLQDLLDQQKKTAFDLQIFKEVFENAVEGITITDHEGNILQVNPAFERITGYSAQEVHGQNPRVLKSDRHPAAFYKDMWDAIKSRGYWSGEIWNKRRNGEVYPELLTISAIRNQNEVITHYTAMFHDISTIVEQQEHIEYLAYHDYLTQLPNRLLLLDRLRQNISNCRRNGGTVVCMVIDLDNFKTVNDSMGHPQGDELLKTFVDRVKTVVREEDTLARMGGDEFIYVFRTPRTGLKNIPTVIERFQSCVDEPFVLLEQKIYVSLSIGIAIYPDDSGTSDDLLKRSDLALYRAKKQVGNSYQFFSHEMEVAVVKKLHYLAKIRNGLEVQEFIPFFQPKVDLASGKPVGMEALARWRSGDKLVNPGDFIPLSEESGLIVPLAQQIYEIAFRETARLREAGYELHLSVNVAPFQLRYENFLSELMALREKTGLPAEYIELEVTESSLMENVQKSKDILQQLADSGFSVSIDDFGTGYSSLQYLKQLPINALKIDMAFVSGIGVDTEDETLIKTIVLMAKQFGLSIVAEGVEKKSQIEFLHNLGCEMGQGFYYGRPMEAAAFEKWLAEQA